MEVVSPPGVWKEEPLQSLERGKFATGLCGKVTRYYVIRAVGTFGKNFL